MTKEIRQAIEERERKKSEVQEYEFTLHSPLTEEDWNKISDVEHENTISVTFQTPQGRRVRYIKCEVLDKIRAEIDHYLFQNEFGLAYRKEVSQIIDKYRK